MKRVTDPFLAGLLTGAALLALGYFIHYLRGATVPEMGWLFTYALFSIFFSACYIGIYCLVALPVFFYTTALSINLRGFASAAFGALTFGLAGALMALLAQAEY